MSIWLFCLIWCHAALCLPIQENTDTVLEFSVQKVSSIYSSICLLCIYTYLFIYIFKNKILAGHSLYFGGGYLDLSMAGTYIYLFIYLFIHQMYQEAKRLDLHVDYFDPGPDTNYEIHNLNF